MQITKIFYAKDRAGWRKWLLKNHDKEKEIWLIFYTKKSGIPRVEYDDAVEEALCFGWIDGQQKGIDDKSFAQRFTPRRPKSNWSALNIERMRKLIDKKLMTDAGIKALGNLDINVESVISEDILEELKKDKEAWDNFDKFSASYKNIRIGFIEGARNRPEEFRRRLSYFLKMTKLNKKFGTQMD